MDTPYYVARGVRVAYEVAKRLQQGNSLDDLKVGKEVRGLLTSDTFVC